MPQPPIISRSWFAPVRKTGERLWIDLANASLHAEAALVAARESDERMRGIVINWSQLAPVIAVVRLTIIAELPPPQDTIPPTTKGPQS